MHRSPRCGFFPVLAYRLRTGRSAGAVIGPCIRFLKKALLLIRLQKKGAYHIFKTKNQAQQ